MKILLDENFPLALYRSLKADGKDVEHIITLGLRGTSDQHIRERLFDKDVLFLTHDDDFLFDRPTEDDRRDERVLGSTERALSDLAAWICLRFTPATGQMAARTARGTGADDQ